MSFPSVLFKQMTSGQVDRHGVKQVYVVVFKDDLVSCLFRQKIEKTFKVCLELKNIFFVISMISVERGCQLSRCYWMSLEQAFGV